MNTDYLVIGTGISGLYCIYKHLKNKNYILIDKNNYIGGRALTVDFHNMPVQMGAGVIRSHDKHLLNLLNELQLELNSFTSTYHFPHLEYYKNNKPNGNELLPLFHNMTKEIQTKYLQNKNNINHLSFQNFINLYFPNDFAQKFMDNALHLDWLDANVKTTIEEYPLNEILLTKNETYYSIKNGGWRVLINKLLEYINKDNIKLQTELVKVIKHNDKFECIMSNGTKIYCKKLIFTADISIKNIQFININPEILNHIDSINFIRVYSYHQNVNFNYNIKTTSILDKIIPITNNILMSCYSENFKANMANELIGDQNKNKLDNLHKLLTNSIGDNMLSKPLDSISAYWEHGIHYYKPNCNLDQSEINQQGLYILGEMASTHQGWVEGCIQSINNIKI
jgi:hypothetical protein